MQNDRDNFVTLVFTPGKKQREGSNSIMLRN